MCRLHYLHLTIKSFLLSFLTAGFLKACLLTYGFLFSLLSGGISCNFVTNTVCLILEGLATALYWKDLLLPYIGRTCYCLVRRSYLPGWEALSAWLEGIINSWFLCHCWLDQFVGSFDFDQFIYGQPWHDIEQFTDICLVLVMCSPSWGMAM